VPDISIGRLRGGLCAYWRDADGKRTRHQLHARTRAEAEIEAVDLYRRLSGGPKDRTIASLWEAYRHDRDGRAVAKTMQYTGKAVLASFGGLTPDYVSTATCRAYTRSRRKAGRKDGAIWTELNHLRMVLSWAAKQRLILRAPAVELPPRPAPRDRYLTREEIARLLDAATQPHIRLAIIIMLSTGARIGAVLELTWDRVDFDRGVLDFRKDATGPRKGRAVLPMNAGLRAALQDARQAALSDHVVEWAAGPVRSIRKGFMAAVQAAGLEDVSPHVIRHTSAVHMVEAGVPMSEVAQMLGHSSTSVTERVYGRFSPGHLQKAADVVDFVKVRALKQG
jgi:integrase